MVAVVVLLVVAVLLDEGPRTGVLSGEGDPADEPSAQPSASVTPTPSGSPGVDACRYVLSGTPARPVLPPGAVARLEPAYAAVLRTSVGDVDVVLDAEAAPCAVHSLLHLVQAGYYLDTPCHRLVTRGIFVLQCGDPTGTGQGGPGYRFTEEGLQDAEYPRGTVAMVNNGPDTTGSQFFLVYDDSPLPAQYTPVGTIGADGLAVLDAVAAAGTGAVTPAGSTPPLVPVQILGVDVTPLDAVPDSVRSDD